VHSALYGGWFLSWQLSSWQIRPMPFSSLYSVEKSKMIEPSGYRFITRPPPAFPRPAFPLAGAFGFGAAPFQNPFRSGCPSAVRGVVVPSTEQPRHGGFAEADVESGRAAILLQPATVNAAAASAAAKLPLRGRY